MDDLLKWAHAHQSEILAALAALWALISVVVKLTPTKRDDEALSKARAFLERLSFLQPKDGVGTLSMPGARARREDDARDRDDDDDDAPPTKPWRALPPPPTTLGILFAVIVAAYALVVSGCGATALERHTMAAAGMHSLATDYQAATLERLGADLNAVASACDERLSDVCRAELGLVADRLRPWVAAGNSWAVAVNAYVDVLKVQADTSARFRDMRVVMRLLRRAVEEYEALVELAVGLGAERPPPLPPMVLALTGASR